MNKQVYDLIMAILGSDLTKDTKDEIVRFFLLPRNTPVKPLIELPDEDVGERLGTVKRPDADRLDRIKHPEKYEGEEAVKETLKGRVEPEKNVIKKV